MTDPNTGRKISNRYELIESIGQGSMGRVYLAGDSLLGGVPVAVKFLSQTLLNEEMRERFLREAMTCAQLGQKSMHVVRVTDYGVNEDEVPFYVMEYLKGDNVGQIVKKQPLPVPRFLGLVRQILLGLRTAHNGIMVNGETVPIIHRDIKPSNILVTSDPSMGELVKILDFGIAKLMQADSEQTSTFMGTLAYASPEQMEGRELDNRSDIYSMGVMMYQMLSGKLPVKPKKNTFGSWYKVHRLAQPKSLVTYKVPKMLDEVVMACLAKQREDRPDSISDILDAIDPLEKRFGSGFQISQQISKTLSKVPVAKDISREFGNKLSENAEKTDQNQSPEHSPEHSLDDSPNHLNLTEHSENTANQSPEHQAADRFYLDQPWPAEMPIAQIVFPKLLTQGNETLPTLWAMMPTAEIEKRIRNTRYNNFMCTMSPHPMVLWLTAFYNKVEGPRWLPCYLDLKVTASQTMMWQLAEAKQYRILFFSKEPPHQCLYVKPLSIAASQLRLLKEWTTNARNFPSGGDPKASKALLKRELESNLKPKILMNFEAMHSDSRPGIDASLGF
ncbi:MAG: serine/threonine-protein kinase [Cyanobacteria bacterium J06621_3]